VASIPGCHGGGIFTPNPWPAQAKTGRLPGRHWNYAKILQRFQYSGEDALSSWWAILQPFPASRVARFGRGWVSRGCRGCLARATFIHPAPVSGPLDQRNWNAWRLQKRLFQPPRDLFQPQRDKFPFKFKLIETAGRVMPLAVALALTRASKRDLPDHLAPKITVRSWVDLSGADLEGAALREADLTEAVLIGANLSHAHLPHATLVDANLSEADLSGADLWGTRMVRADLTGANLTHAHLLDTVFSDSRLTKVQGLDRCQHGGPSSIDFRTLEKSGPLPVAFMRGVGLPDNLIEYLPTLLNSAIRHYSCFISYSSKDQTFAERLHADLQNKAVRCWFAPHDMRIGARIIDTVDEAIRVRDKVLLILSEGAVASDWVEDEVTTAFEEERKRKEVVLFPVRLDDAVMQTSEAWAAKLRARHIGDFRRWKEQDNYQKSLERLMRDLRVEKPGQ
jgi:TIR domain/Pentapeptide repeats (8 copies)